MRGPSSRGEDIQGDAEAVRSILRQAAAEGRRILTEPEAKAVIRAYHIPVSQTEVAHDAAHVRRAAERLLKETGKVVIKLLCRTITHKSDVVGVILDIESPEAAAEAAGKIERNLKELGKADEIDGFSVQPMIARDGAQELILGLDHDEMFGPTIFFGAGGTAVEILDDAAIALPPLDDVLASDLIDRTRVGRLLAGYRNHPAADRHAILHALNAMSQLAVDFPSIVSIDINPTWPARMA
jgi:acetyltransferase